MNVIVDATGLNQVVLTALQDAGDVWEEWLSKSRDEDRPAFLGAKYEMDVEGCE
jgi:hypothetical protein